MPAPIETTAPAKVVRAGRFRRGLDLVATVLMLAASGIVLWLILWPSYAALRHDAKRPREFTTLAGVPVLGSPSAPVAVIAFSDFECPFCARFARDTWPVFKSRWIDTGQVRFGFRHLPLARHPRARRAAEAAACAQRQGRFWAMHDELFKHDENLAESDLPLHALAAGLDTDQFVACMAGPAAAQVADDINAARALKLEGTPTFVVGRVDIDGRVAVVGVLHGALPMAQFEKVIAAVGVQSGS